MLNPNPKPERPTEEIDYSNCAFPKKVAIRLKGKKYTEFKKRLYKRASGRCETCGQPVPLTIYGRFNPYKCAHLSHIISIGAGGGDTEDNCKIECFKCHRKKHDGVKNW